MWQYNAALNGFSAFRSFCDTYTSLYCCNLSSRIDPEDMQRPVLSMPLDADSHPAYEQFQLLPGLF